MAAGTAPNIKTPKVDTSQLLDLLVQARQKSQTNTVQIVRPNVTKTVSESNDIQTEIDDNLTQISRTLTQLQALRIELV